MSNENFQIFVVFEGKTYSCEASYLTNILDFKKFLAKKFKLPYIKNMTLFPELDSPTPFYLKYSSKRVDDSKFDTILDFNNYHQQYQIEKEATIQLMIIFSSKIWNMIQQKIISREEFILEDI
jgi:hypothetical protein